MISSPLSIAFSPCPNDTYIFYALTSGLLGDVGFSLEKEVFEDVESLNLSAFNEKYDITKISFHAYGHISDKYSLLSAGSALGRGCGPLLVTKNGRSSQLDSFKTIAIPGRYTTAAMLLKLYYPKANTIEMSFDKIMDSVASNKVDAGVVIHESRFTFESYGLKKVADLGEWWEDKTGSPIPLGGIAVKKSLGNDIYQKVDQAVKMSVQWANDHDSASLPYIKKHSQELDDEVIKSHIALYVNHFSSDLNEEGRNAILKFLKMGNDAGLFLCNLEKTF